MPWTIERKHDHVAVVTMNTNKVNAQNPTFFDDLHSAFDRLETEFNNCAIVLTGTCGAFSAGLDFDHHFPLFARQSLKEIDAWFDGYRATNLRLFTYPRPTVAAINGHAYAGGLITALGCDHRIASDGALQFSLNEVPIGIPMPAVYCEIIKHAIGSRAANELTLWTVAAINGHAYAGGLITALGCDHRIASDGALQFSLNEVPIGIPMPAVYCEIIKHAIGSRAANELTLFGQVYDLAAAARMGVIDKTALPSRLLDDAVAWAALVPPDCYPAYAFAKRALQATTMAAIDAAARLDRDWLSRCMSDPASLRAHARRYRELKGREITWSLPG